MSTKRLGTAGLEEEEGKFGGKMFEKQWGAFYLLNADFFAIGGDKELVVLLLLSAATSDINNELNE